jgi:hypothetical protein
MWCMQVNGWRHGLVRDVVVEPSPTVAAVPCSKTLSTCCNTCNTVCTALRPATTAHLTSVRLYCKRSSCCDMLPWCGRELLVLSGNSTQDCCGSCSAVSSKLAVMSTPRGTRPLTRQAATCVKGHVRCYTRVGYRRAWGQCITHPVDALDHGSPVAGQQPGLHLPPFLPADPRHRATHECTGWPAAADAAARLQECGVRLHARWARGKAAVLDPLHTQAASISMHKHAQVTRARIKYPCLLYGLLNTRSTRQAAWCVPLHHHQQRVHVRCCIDA